MPRIARCVSTPIYITPIMWFNMPAPLVKWLDQVLLYEKTFVITGDTGWIESAYEKHLDAHFNSA